MVSGVSNAVLQVRLTVMESICSSDDWNKAILDHRVVQDLSLDRLIAKGKVSWRSSKLGRRGSLTFWSSEVGASLSANWRRMAQSGDKDQWNVSYITAFQLLQSTYIS
jgi:hypothetical protein